MQAFIYLVAALSLLTTPSLVSGKTQKQELLTSARRRTEDVDASYFEYGLSSFSVRFEKCQYVKSFDDEVAEDEDEDSVLAMKHFVVFKICPSDECQTSCNGVHGNYVADIQDYLAATVEYEQEEFETMCDNCNERCNDEGEYCSGCGKLCYQWVNLENQGYVDASQYIECQQLEIDNDDDDDGDDEVQYYVGPKCGSNGESIRIGLFADENCFEPIDDMDVEDLIGAKLSYHVLSNVVSTSSDSTTCLSCKESGDDDDNNNEDDEADEDNVNEMCEELYNIAAKCESPYGLTAGFIDVNREDNDYENQVENEFMACNFIDSLIWNSYSETGEINSWDDQDAVIRAVTTNQLIALSFLGLAFLIILGYGWYLHKAIEKATRKVDLSSQGDGVVA